MVAKSLTHAGEQLKMAIHVMATTNLPLRKRLDYAHQLFGSLETHDFDGFPEMQEEFAELMDWLTRYGDNAGKEGPVLKTISKSSDEEIDEIADRIFEIFVGVYHS